MSKKMKQQFKERILTNKINSEVKAKEREVKIEEMKVKKVVTVELEEKNLIAKVDRGNLFVSQEEVKELIKDLFYTNTELKENSIINLELICDVYYKLAYKGKINDELLFSLC